LHKGEIIEAFVYGTYPGGWGMLVATNWKLLFIDKMFLDCVVEEIPYSMISSIDHRHGHILSEVTVHSRAKDYPFRRVNRNCAFRLIEHVEKVMIDTQLKLAEQEKLVQEEIIRRNSLNLQFPPGYLRDLKGSPRF
jgi:hypothetical protein